MKRIGVFASLFNWACLLQQWVSIQKDIFGKNADSMKTAINCGLRSTMHSDFNYQPVGPLSYIHNSVTRKIKVSGQVLNPGECLIPYQSIKGATIDTAWECRMDNLEGSIEKDKMADFVLLADDPFKCCPDDIIKIQISQAWMGEVLRYQNKGIKDKTEVSIKQLNSQTTRCESKKKEFQNPDIEKQTKLC